MTSQLGQKKGVKYTNGQWRKVDRILAPSGTDAQALQKHKSTRLLAGAKRKGDDESGVGEGRQGGDKGYHGIDTIANDSDMIKSQRPVARMNENKRGGEYGNDGRLIHWAERRTSVGDTCEGEDVTTTSSSSSPFTSEVGAVNKDLSHSGDDRSTSDRVYETNNGFNEIMRRNCSSTSEKDGPHKSGLDFTTLSVAGSNEGRKDCRDKGVTAGIDKNDGDYENCNDGNAIDIVTAEQYDNRTESQIFDEMEQDLHDLIEISISLNEQWIKRCEEGHDDDDAEGFEEAMRLQQCQQFTSPSDVAESLATSSAKVGEISMSQGLPASSAEGQRAERMSDEGGLEVLLSSSFNLQLHQPKPSGRQTKWSCVQCTFLSSNLFTRCEACGASRCLIAAGSVDKSPLLWKLDDEDENFDDGCRGGSRPNGNTASSLSSEFMIDSRKKDAAVTARNNYLQRQGQHQHLLSVTKRTEGMEIAHFINGGPEKLSMVVSTTSEIEEIGGRKNYNLHQQHQDNPITDDQSGDGREDTAINGPAWMTFVDDGVDRQKGDDGLVNNATAMVSVAEAPSNMEDSTLLPSFRTGVDAPDLDQSQLQPAVSLEQTDFGSPPMKSMAGDLSNLMNRHEMPLANHNSQPKSSENNQAAAVRAVHSKNEHSKKKIENAQVHNPSPMDTVDARGGASIPGMVGEIKNKGRWTMKEHEAFLSGLQMFGRQWTKISAIVKTRTPNQTSVHAQNYFKHLSKGGVRF